MNGTGLNSEKTGYRVVILLVVGLTAFSSAMKELNQVQQLGLDATRLVAHLSAKMTPAEVPQTVVQVETCERKQSKPSVELPWLHDVAETQTDQTEEGKAPVVAKRIRISKAEVTRVNRARRLNVDALNYEVRILNEHDGAELAPVISEFSLLSSKVKTRKHHTFKITPRDRGMLLKTQNRSISLRFAS